MRARGKPRIREEPLFVKGNGAEMKTWNCKNIACQGWRRERCGVSPVGSQGQMGWPGNKREDEPKSGHIPAPPSWWGSETGPEPASFSRLVDSCVQRNLC